MVYELRRTHSIFGREFTSSEVSEIKNKYKAINKYDILECKNFKTENYILNIKINSIEELNNLIKELDMEVVIFYDSEIKSMVFEIYDGYRE